MNTGQTIIDPEPGTSLVLAQRMNAAQLFAPGAINTLLDRIKAEVRAIDTDVSTAKGREAIKSLAYKVSKTKTAIEAARVALVSDEKKRLALIDAEGKRVRDELDALRDEVRKPLDDYQAAEAARIAGHERALAEIESFIASGSGAASSSDIQTLIDRLPSMLNRDWQEFTKRADASAEAVATKLQEELSVARKREAEAEELARLRAEQEIRERKEAALRQREREAAIAAKAAEDARIAVELRAREEAAKAEREAAYRIRAAEDARRLAEQQAAQAERDRIEAEARAEAGRIASEQRVKRERAAVVEAERARAAAAIQEEEEAAAKRAADTQHRSAINRAALAALVASGLSEHAGKTAITAIANGTVPNVRIIY